MSDTFPWDDTTSVSRDGVTVEREIEGRDDGIIVTMDLHADVSGPLRVDVLDEFPADIPAEQAGFNVEYEPDEGDLSLERAEIRHTIEDESARIVYAIRLSEPIEAVEFDDPSIEDVTLPGLSGGVDTNEGTDEVQNPVTDDGDGIQTRGDGDGDVDGGDGAGESVDSGTEASTRESMAFDSSGFESSAETDRTAEASPVDADGVSETDSSSGSKDAANRGSNEVDGADVERPGDDRVDSSRSSVHDAEAIERAIAETERSGGDGPAEGDAATGSGDDPGEDRTDTSGGSVDGAASRGDDGSGTTADPPREGAGAPAESGTNTGDEMSRSVRLRLDRLNARVEEFATYAEALEDIIEREGTGPEIIENLESNLSDVNERLEEARADVDSLQSEHAADVSTVRDRIDSLEDELEEARSDLRSDVVNVRGTVDDIGADVERVDHESSENAEDVEAVREHLETVESAVHSLDDRVDDHEADIQGVNETVESVQTDVAALSESVEAMRSDVQSLQVDVERLLRFREILSDVFGGPVQRATEGSRGLADLGEDRPDDDGSISTPSEHSR